MTTDDRRILAIDVGAGTQDILIYDPERTPENCFRLVMPSRTQIVGNSIRKATAKRRAVHLTGPVMGGGASTIAVADHVAAGLPISATPSAAATIHNNPDRVHAAGVLIANTAPANAVVIQTGDIDLESIASGLAAFGIEIPTRYAVAVQDHGVRIGRGNNDVRGEYLEWLVNQAHRIDRAAFVTPPDAMTRMQAVQKSVPGAVVMDTGAAAVLGALRDPMVASAASTGAVLINIGNMHTFAVLMRDHHVLGVFEHHSHGMNADLAANLVNRLRNADLDNAGFRAEFDGHGAVIADEYLPLAPFDFVAVTGPNRALVDGLGWYQAAPHGDMMLTGSFGLVDGFLAANGNG